jgi:hypothetical protein
MVTHESDALVKCTKPCEKLPCDYVRQLQMKVFIGKLFRSKKLRAEAAAYADKQLGPGASATDKSHLAGDRLYDEIRRIAADPKQNKLPACAGSTLDEPPGAETMPDCSVRLTDPRDSSKTLKTPLEKLNTCAEFVDASKAHEENHVDACSGVKAGLKWPDGRTWDRQDMKTFADEEASAYEREVYYLRRSRDGARKRCTRRNTPPSGPPVSEADAAKNALANALALAGGGK